MIPWRPSSRPRPFSSTTSRPPAYLHVQFLATLIGSDDSLPETCTSKRARMIQPEELKKNEPLKWSTGTGTDVWEMFCACIAGDLETVKRLLTKDPSLVRCHYAYRTPIYFAVRENQIEVAAFLLDHGADPIGLAVNDSLLEIARDRGYVEMEELLEAKYASLHGASPKGEAVAAAIRERDLEQVKSLLDAAPELLHAGDGRSNQPIHWAVMTRQLDAHRRAAGPRRRHQRATSGWRAPDSTHQRRLSLSRLARRPERRPDDARRSARAPACPRRIRRHLHGRQIGDLDRVRELLDQDPSLANRVLGVRHVLRRLRVAAQKRRRQGPYRDREAAARARRRSESARGGNCPAWPCAVFGRLQRTPRDRQAAAGTWRLPESAGRKLRRRAEHRAHRTTTRRWSSCSARMARPGRRICWPTTAMSDGRRGVCRQPRAGRRSRGARRMPRERATKRSCG